MRALGALLLAAAPWGFAQADWAFSLPSPGSTSLIEIRQGSELSRQVRSLHGQGYESSGGEQVDFATWYSSNWTDMRATWMTPLSANTGFIWGFGTGERGPKYRIDPSLRLGAGGEIDPAIQRLIEIGRAAQAQARQQRVRRCYTKAVFL